MGKNKLSFAIRTEDEGGFSAQCIEFPGIITQADTEPELKEMIDDAVSGYFEAFPEEKDRLDRIKKGKIIKIAI
jgi:predicted RNase H-like HicB family nuclease